MYTFYNSLTDTLNRCVLPLVDSIRIQVKPNSGDQSSQRSSSKRRKHHWQRQLQTVKHHLQVHLPEVLLAVAVGGAVVSVFQYRADERLVLWPNTNFRPDAYRD